nr:PepSY-associated TM helix domain-containing protein [Sphingomonas arenae]
MRAAKAPRRPLAYRLHSLFGLKLSLLLAFVCLTGTIAAISHEIEWLLFPEVRATAAEQPVSWGTMWEAARQHRPEGWLRSIGPYDRSDVDYFAKDAIMRLPDGREVTVLIDPGTGAVTGEQLGTPFHAFMRGLHYYLFTPGDWGFYLVTSLGFVLLASLVTGLIVYKRFWGGLFKRPRTERGSRTLLGDLHRLFALWALPFTALIALTSIWYFAERTGVAWELEVPTTASPLRQQPSGAEVDDWVRTAVAAMPGIHVTGVSIPWSDGDPVVVQGEWRAWLVRERTNAAYLDPATGKLIGLRVAHRMGAGERIVHTADPLHFGNFAGLAGKLLWFVFGLMLTALAISGAMIHGKRLWGADAGSLGGAWRRSLGSALIPSLLLTVAVPGWYFLNGWQTAGMTLMEPAGTIASDAGSIPLLRSTEDSTTWCAKPESRSSGAVFTLSDGAKVDAVFDAGLYCVEVPHGRSVVALVMT